MAGSIDGSGGNSGNQGSLEPASKSQLPRLGDILNPSVKSGEPSYIDGDVSAVKAVEFGADMYGSCTSRSCGDTVPTFVTELPELPATSYVVGRPGDEKAVADIVVPPPRVGKPSSSRPLRSMCAGDSGKLPAR